MKFLDAIDSIDLSSRRCRRDATILAIRFIGIIHLEESKYLHRIPANLRDDPAYEASDETLSYLVEAIDNLEYAYSEPTISRQLT